MDKIFAENIESAAKVFAEAEAKVRLKSDAGVKQDMTKYKYDMTAFLAGVFHYVCVANGKKNRTILEMLHVLNKIKETGESEFLAFFKNDALEMMGVDLVSKKLKNMEDREAFLLHAARVLEYYTLHVAEDKGKQKQKVKEMVEKISTKTVPGAWECIVNSKKTGDVPFPLALWEYLNYSIVGQEELKKMLAMYVYRYLKYGQRNVLLMVGSTGTGKNYSIQILADFLKDYLVVHTVTANNLTPNGYAGYSISEIFKEFKRKCEKAGKPVTQGIIFIDEVDKIMSYTNTDSNGEDMNTTLQQQLLTILAGTEEIEGVDTKDLLFVLGGAFPKLYEFEEEKNRARKIGFSMDEEAAEQCSQVQLKERLIGLGGQRELVGRITSIVRLHKLDRKNIRKILLHEKNGVLYVRKEMFAEEGMELVVEDSAVEAIVDKIWEENLGARSAESVVNQLIGTYDFEMYVNNSKKMIIHEGMVRRGEKPYFL